MYGNRAQELVDLPAGIFRRNDFSLPMPRHGRPTVFVVHGDPGVRKSLEALILSAQWDVQVFDSASAFLSCQNVRAPGCLVLDTALPDLCGLELQERLNRIEAGLPTIFLMEQADIAVAVRAMRAGAVEVLAKPIDLRALLGAIDEAMDRSRIALEEHSIMSVLREDYASLSRREREVMGLVASGLLNKQVAWELGISEITVKAHRGQAMRKMKARSFVDLLNKAARLDPFAH